jgi:hypothetical protein
VENGSCAFWEGVIGGVLPSTRMPTFLLKKYCPLYGELRHYSKMSLANQLTIQHVVLFDVTCFPITWLTNVALSQQVGDLALAVWFCIPSEQRPADSMELELIGNGILLDLRKTLGEHVWPGRSGRSGCRGDLCLVVKGLQLSPAARAERGSLAPLEFSDVISRASELVLTGKVV